MIVYSCSSLGSLWVSTYSLRGQSRPSYIKSNRCLRRDQAWHLVVSAVTRDYLLALSKRCGMHAMGPRSLAGAHAKTGRSDDTSTSKADLLLSLLLGHWRCLHRCLANLWSNFAWDLRLSKSDSDKCLLGVRSHAKSWDLTALDYI